MPPFWYLGEKHEGHEGARNQIFTDSGSILGSTPIQKPAVLRSKTVIFKVSIRRKRILESQNYHFVEKWIWESQNFHFVEQKDLGKSKLPFRRKKKGCGKVSMSTTREMGSLGLLNTVSYSHTQISTNSSTGPMTADNQTVFEAAMLPLPGGTSAFVYC